MTPAPSLGGDSTWPRTTDVDLTLDYHAASIGADLGDAVLVTEVELTPLSDTHRVEPEHLRLLTANFNIDGGWTETTDFRYESDADGTIRFVLREPITATYVKVHAHWNELDAEGNPVDRATFVNATEEILTVTYLVRSREEHYSYDGKGNRLTELITTDLTTDDRTYTYYPNTDRLKSDGRSGYVYDNNGNLMAKGSVFTDLGDSIDIDSTTGEYWEYAYDLLNRMTSASILHEGAMRTVATYTYDHRGYRIRRTGDDRPLEAEEAPEVTTTLFTFDTAGRVIEETTGTETVASIFAFGKHLAKVENPGTPEEATYYYLTDHVGSTVGITDDTGLLLWQDDAVPFGESAGEAGLLDEDLKFTGKDVDPATGLYYFNARWYDAATGRFTTEDPIRDGWNWYQYARSNPLRWVDPSGLEIVDLGHGWLDTETGIIHDEYPSVPEVGSGEEPTQGHVLDAEPSYDDVSQYYQLLYDSTFEQADPSGGLQLAAKTLIEHIEPSILLDLGFVMPLELANLYLSSEYDFQYLRTRDGVVPRFHAGWDFPVPIGTPVVAAHSGYLTSGFNEDFGLHANIEYARLFPNDTEVPFFEVSTQYSHLSTASIQSGSFVERGQVIGFSGDTGFSTGPHLDFRVFVEGMPVDPARFYYGGEP